MRTLGVAVAATVWGLGVAPTAAPPPPAPGLPAALRDYRLPLAHTRLENGLRVVVSEDHASPVVAVNVMYRAGVRAESPGRSGLAHFFEHLMFQGTATVDRENYARTINGLGGRYNGATRIDYANYYTVAPANALDLLLWMEADRMRGLKLTAEVLENQRAVVLEEVTQSLEHSGAGQPLGEALQALAFSKWRNAHSGYGELADLRAATLEDMRAFYDRFYVPSNAVLVVVGDCDPARVFARAERYFGPLERTPAPPVADVSEAVPGREERSAVQKVTSHRAPVIGIGYRLPARTTRPFLALSMLNTILGRDERGLLRRALVDERQLATSVTASFHDLGNDLDFDGPMLYTIVVEARPGRSTAEVLGVVDEVMAHVRERLTAGDLADARVGHAMWFLGQLAGPGNAHATRARTIAAFTLFDGTPDGVNGVLPGTAALTVADLQAAAQTYLVPSNRVWVARQPE